MAKEPVFIANPHLSEEDQGMEMKETVFGPPGYGSPDPMTNAQALVPVHESGHDLSDDYGVQVPEEKNAHAPKKKSKAKKSDEADAEA
jgi:hypothetical protein